MEAEKEVTPFEIMCECSGCGRKFRESGKGKSYEILTLGVFTKPGMIAPSLPVLLCLGCGSLRFMPESLRLVRENLKKANSKIITIK